MNKLNKIQKLNILIYLLLITFCIFQIAKVIFYSTNRPLYSADYQCISSSISMLAMFTIFFVFSMIFFKTGKFRKTTFVMFIVWIVLFSQIIYQKAVDFSHLFFKTENFIPSFADKFTSLFELCNIALLAIALTAFFIYLIKIK